MLLILDIGRMEIIIDVLDYNLAVKVGMDLSKPFDTMRGFRQGDPPYHATSSTSLWRVIGVHRNGTIFQKSVQLLAYADDIDIIKHSKRDVTAAFSAFEL